MTPPRPHEYLASLLAGAPPGNAVPLVLAYGLDRFESELSDIVAASGVPLEDLQELAEEARLGSNSSAPKVKDQHLVTKALLREWCSPTPNGPRMGHYSTKYGIRPDVSPQSVAKLEDFIKIDSKRTEEEWGRVETHLPTAIAAAQAGELFRYSDLVDIIRKGIALHYARSFDVKETYDTFSGDFLAAKEADYRSNPALIEHLHQLKTKSAATPTPAEREAIIKEFLAGPAHLRDSGIMFRYRVVHYFKSASTHIGDVGLELLRAPAGSEFVIGDVPVITTDKTGHQRGIAAGVPIGSARVVVMPLSPTLSVALARTNRDEVIPAGAVERLNLWQIEAAKRGVFTRKGSPLLEWIPTIRPPSFSGGSKP